MDQAVRFRIELESNGEKVLHSLSINADDFSNALKQALGGTQRLTAGLSGLTEGAILFSSLNAIVGQLQSSVEGLAGTFNSFDKGMRAVNTMAQRDEAGLAMLKDQVEALAATIPLAKSELANGLYQVISNGVPEDNWISFLEASSRSAVGGIADLGQTVTVTSTIIKNYGESWSAAGAIQDKIQMTAKNGVTSFEQMGQALPRVTGNAAILGVTIDELLASFATLTGVSGNTAEVSTQLAAVFTALVKPSSEATEMAREMGIQFDAAAIQAAGGWQNFIQIITQSITQYAATHGMLEQEIYGRLFGSAEALRALIPLTGELSDTFNRNVQAMADSSGTIDQAFEQMAGGGEAVSQMLSNQMSTIFDWAGSIASSIQPYLSFVAVGGQAIAGLTLLGGAAKKAMAAIVALTAAHKSNVVISTIAAMHERIQSFALNMLTASSLTATAGTWALTAAVTALYAALTLGISLIITGLVSLFASMGDEAEETAESVDILKESTDAFKNSASNAKAELDMEISTLASLIKQNKEAAKKVEELNRKYGEAMGHHKTAAEWYDTLVRKSRAYCTQLGYEAQAKVLASQIAAKELERDQKQRQRLQLGQQYMDNYGTHYNWERVAGGKDLYEQLGRDLAQLNSDIAVSRDQYNTCISRMVSAQGELSGSIVDTSAAINWQTMNYADLGRAIEQQKTKVASLAGVNAEAAKREGDLLKQMQARHSDLGKQYGLSDQSASSEFDGKKLIANAESYKALGNNIAFYQSQLEKTPASETATINMLSQKIARLKEAQEAIKATLEAAGRPMKLDTLEDINKEIAYQQNLRNRATSENIAGIDAEIRRLNALKTALEEASYVVLGVEQIQTYEQLDAQLAYYQNQLKRATETERVEIQKQIYALQQLRQTWDTALAGSNAPAAISQLDTIEKLDAAISYYADAQKRASASEVESIQRTIVLLEAKRNAMTRLTEIPAMQQDMADLSGLYGKGLKLELELIGLDGIKGKIRDLQKMLDDTKNPLNAEQRQEVQRLVGSWQMYEAQLKKSQIKLTDAWGSIKGIGGGIQGITDALKGNGAAWERVVAIVDGVISLYQSFTAIVEIVRTLTAASAAHAAVKHAEAAAETTEMATNTAAAATAITNSAAVTAATNAETTAHVANAAAKTMSAHAGIPWVGIAIGAAMVATLVGVMASLPKFAHGGIAYGPTLGIFGEYAGASHNPEVVAPLDRLKALIGGGSGDVGGDVEFKVKGRRLVGLLKRENNIHKRG